MNRKMRKETQIGLLLIAANGLLTQFTPFHDVLSGFASGLFIGLGFAFTAVGLLPEKAYAALKSVKGKEFSE